MTDSAARDWIFLSREDYEFQKGMLSDQEILLLLKRNQMSILTAVFVEICFTILWILCSIVPGFALYNGDVNRINAYTHLGWWLIIELLCIVVGCISTFFSLGYSSVNGQIERNVGVTLKWMYVYCFFLALTGVSHVVHGILSIFERTHCDPLTGSTLCKDYSWVLLTAICVWFVWGVAVNGWTILRATVYANNLNLAIRMGRIDMAISLPSKDKKEENDYNVVVDRDGSPPPGTTQAAPAALQINTPLLAQLNKSGGGAQRHGAVLHRMK